MRSITFTVFGTAQPAGSKRGVVHPHTGHVLVLDANPRSREWKEAVAGAAAWAYKGPLLEGALELEMTFYRARPRGHMGTGGNEGLVKDRAPAHPTSKPDLTKLLRGTEDALRGIVFRDDSQVVKLSAEKHYGSPARVEITVTSLPERTFAELTHLSLAA